MVDVKLALYTKFWTSLMWIMLILLSVGLYIAYMWLAGEVAYFIVYQTTAKLFSTYDFYLIVALSVGVVFLADTSYIYIKKEYFTETVDYLKAIVKKGQEDDRSKLEMIEHIAMRSKARKGNSTELSMVPDVLIESKTSKKHEKKYKQGDTDIAPSKSDLSNFSKKQNYLDSPDGLIVKETLA